MLNKLTRYLLLIMTVVFLSGCGLLEESDDNAIFRKTYPQDCHRADCTYDHKNGYHCHYI